MGSIAFFELLASVRCFKVNIGFVLLVLAYRELPVVRHHSSPVISIFFIFERLYHLVNVVHRQTLVQKVVAFFRSSSRSSYPSLLALLHQGGLRWHSHLVVWKLADVLPPWWWLRTLLCWPVWIELCVALVRCRFRSRLRVLDRTSTDSCAVSSLVEVLFLINVTRFTLIVLAQWERITLVNVPEPFKFSSDVLELLVLVSVRCLRDHPVHGAKGLLDELNLVSAILRTVCGWSQALWLIHHQAPRSSIR